MILLLNVHLSLVVCTLTPYYIYIIILYLEIRPPEWPLKQHRYVYDHYTLSRDSIVEKVKTSISKYLKFKSV